MLIKNNDDIFIYEYLPSVLFLDHENHACYIHCVSCT